MTEKNPIQLAMSEFVQRWKEAGNPLDEDWYKLFMSYKCPNLEFPNACKTGYCPMGDDDCTRLINQFS